MSDSRCRCRPRRPTYPTLRSDFQNSSRSTVTFQAHASGFLKALLCVVTTKGTWLVPVPPGLSTEQNRVADAEASEETAAAGTEHGFVVELIGNTQARLDVAPLNIGVMVRNIAEQAVVKTRGGFGNATVSGRRECGSRNNHAVIELGDRG